MSHPSGVCDQPQPVFPHHAYLLPGGSEENDKYIEQCKGQHEKPHFSTIFVISSPFSGEYICMPAYSEAILPDVRAE